MCSWGGGAPPLLHLLLHSAHHKDSISIMTLGNWNGGDTFPQANIENCRFLVVVQARLPQFFKVAGKQVQGRFLQPSVSQASSATVLTEYSPIFYLIFNVCILKPVSNINELSLNNCIKDAMHVAPRIS